MATTNGTTTSFGNTPQATDDYITAALTGLTEDSTGIVYLDVLANDLGGAAKTLFSIDNGISAGGTRPTDLLTQDTGRAEATSTDTSLNGAKIWITTDGKIGYDVNTLTAAFKDQLQHLGAGEYLTDSFTYSIRLGNGTLSWANATVQIAGTNDAPVVTGAVKGATVEDGSKVTMNALANASDVDTGTVLHVVNVPATLPAGVTYDAANHAFTLDPSNAAYQHLAAGQTTTVSVSYGVSDGAVTTAASVSFTITGTNDAPVVTSAVTGSAVEDGAKVTLNALANASDVDDGAVLTVVNVPSSLPAGVSYDAATHSFTLDPANAAYQHLAAGQTTTVTVNYGVSDGVATTGASVSFTITGTNDAPVVSGAVTGTAVEDGAKATLNALANAGDVDDGTVLSVVNVPASLPSGVSYDAATHSFTLDPTDAAYQHLAAGATTTVTVNYGVSDGIATTAASVSFTVTGTNDAPIVSGAVTGSGVEDGAKVTLNGLANASDVDDGAVLTVVNVPSSLPGGVSYDAATHSFTLDPTNAAYQSLAAGQTTTVTVNYGVSDGIATTAASVSFTVTGTNDAPVVTNSSAATAGSVKEDAVTSVSGQLSASDVDTGATQAWSVHGSDTGTYGSIAVDAGGQWTYTLNNGAANVQALAAGESHDETFTIRVTDDQGAYVDQTITVTVNGTNDAPVVTGVITSGAAEDGSTVTLYALAHASDVDNGTTLAVTNVPATLPAGVTYDAGTQSFTLDPSDAAYQHLAQGQTTVVTVSYGVTDGIATTPASVSFTVTGTNDAPVVTGAVTGTATEDGATAIVNVLTNASDVDDSTVLAVTNVPGTLPAGVTYDAIAQTFTLDPSDTAYQHLAQGQTTIVTVNYGVTDGIATTAASVSFTVTGTNDAPVVTGAVSGTATEDGATATVNALANASDVDDSTVLAVADVPTTLPAGVTYDAVAQTFTLDPSDTAYQHLAQGQTTLVAVNYGVTDGIATTAASISFTVTGTNDAPVVTGAVASNATEDGSTVTLNALANASDVDDSTTLSVVNVPASLPAGISYDEATHSFTLDPSDAAYQSLAQGETTTVTMNYGVTDGIATSPASVSFTITGTNDTPVVTNAASELAGSTKEDTVVSASGQLSASDVDHGATQTWSVEGADAGTYGNIAVDAGGKWTYTLNNGAGNVQALALGESHDESFTIRVTDDHGAYADQTVTVTVTGTNDAPVVTNAAAQTAGSIHEDVVTTISGQLSASDIDNGATQGWSVQGGDTGTYGSIAVDASGKWTYTLNNDASNVQALAAGESHDETFTVRVTDDKGAYVDQTVTVTVSGTNDAPVVTGTVTGSATEDQNTVTLDALANASDVDNGTTLSVVGVPVTLPAGVTYDATSHFFTLDPSDAAYQHLAQGQTATVTINYSVSDSITTTPAAVSFTITGTNDAPAVTGAVTGSATEDGSTATLNALANASDVDDNTVLSVVGVPVSLPAGVSYDAITHSFTLNPADNAFQSLAQGETTTVTVNYGVSDGIATTSASVSWTVTGTNDIPVVTNTAAELAGSVQEDTTTAISGQLSVSDVDHNATQAWSVQGGDTGTYGSIAVDANGKWTYTLNNDSSNVQSLAEGESHDETFTIRVTDDQGAFVDQTVTVTVTGTNDAPVVSGTVSSDATEDQNTVTLNALANASDVDNGASLSVVNVPVSLPAGVSYDTASHSFTVDPSDAAYQHLAQGQTETVTVSYGVSDGMATTAAAVSFTVTGTNDAPVVTGAVTAAATEDGTTSTVNALANASDVDDNTVLTVTNVPVTLPAGITYDAAAQTFTLDPSDSAYQHLAQGQTEIVTVSYGVTDGIATTAATASFTVTGTNDAPVVTGAVTGAATEDGATATVNALANASDVDESTVLAVTNVPGTLPAGVTYDAVAQTFTLDPSDPAYQHLAQGQTEVVTVSYGVTDGIATTAATASFTVTGTNDAPVVSGAVTGTATEDGSTVTLNALANASDVDDSTTLSVVNVPSLPAGVSYDAATHAFTLNPADAAFQSLAAGQTTTVTVNYGVSDGIATTNASVSWTVTGTNDVPVISGTASGGVTEDVAVSGGNLHASGGLSIVDADQGQSAFAVQSGTAGSNGYGSFTLDASGNWTYTANDSQNAIQQLGAGQTLTDSFTAVSSDGTASRLVTITITGTNDAPVITSGATASTPENVSTSTAVYTVAATDIDGPSLTYSLSGTDASLFNIDSGTGAVTFKTSPNYEAPADAGGNNVYDIVVHANDGTADTAKAVAITVTDVIETPTTTISNIHISSDTGSSNSDFITKSAAQTITATLSAPLAAGESVLGSIDGGATWSAVTSVSGTSVSWNATLAGSSAIEFKVVNTDNQSGPVAIQSYVLDTTIATPTVSGFSTDSATPGDHITSDNTLVITGTAEAGSSVTVKDGTTVLGTVTADNSGAWSFGPSTVLTDGTHNFTAVSTDVADNSATSSVFAVTVDTSSPNAPVISAINDNVSPVTGTVANNGFSNDTTPTLSGTAEANSIVTIKDGVSTLGTATTDGSGNWSFTTAALTQGAHSFTATATDQAGNVSGSSAAYAETIDATEPTAAVSITAIASDTGSSSSDFITNDTSLTVSGTNGTLGSGEKVQVSSDGGTTWADATVTSTTWSYIDPTAHNTSFTYQVRVVDLAGNVGNTSSHAVTIDTTAPTATVAITAIASDTGVSGDFITNDTSLTVSGTNGTLGSGEKVQVSSDGGTTWGDATVNGNTWSFNDPTTHSTSFTYQARIVDTAGNVDANTASKAITIDTSVSAPTSLDLAAADDTGTSNTDNITKNTSGLTISGSGENGATVTLFDDANGNGTQNGNEATLGTGTVSNGSFSIDISLTAGTHHVAAFQTDLAGNVSGSSTLDITVDTTPPNAAVAITAISSDTGASSSDFITNDTSLTVSGTNGALSSGDRVQVSSDGGTTWADATVTNTTWSYTDSATHSTSFTYQVRVVDLADNVGNTASHAVTIDTTAPTLIISESPNLGNASGATTTLTFQFSETVTGFTIGDIATTRGSVSNFVAVDGDTYTATFTRSASGAANVSVAASSYTDIAGNSGTAASSGNLPVGIAGEAINLALVDPTSASGDMITVTVAGMLTGWTLNQGVNNGDGSWTIQTSDPSALTVMTPSDYAGAAVLAVTYSWTNADGNIESIQIADNVEAYTAGSPIFALSGDDHLTGSSGSDLFVFAQPITNDVIHSFDLAVDKIDLVGFSNASGFNDLQIANDVAGNAVITLASGETITLLGVDAGALTAGNFLFDQEPVMANAGTMTVSDGAMLPIGGIIDNTGTIVLGSTNDATELEILVKSVTLQGGGQLVMSDNANNIIYGGTSDATLDNLDNTISGAGQIGQGQMTLVNEGTILANGSNALVIDTGIHAVTNAGTLEATGSGGLIINGDLSNNGLLWANDGNITVGGNVSGSGSALIGGSATIEFGSASSQDTTFADVGNGTLKLDQSTAYTGMVSGFNEGDRLDFADILSGPGTTINFTENDAGVGGTLTLSDGTHTTAIKLQGQYSVDGFHISADSGAGTIVSYLPTNHSEPAV